MLETSGDHITWSHWWSTEGVFYCIVIRPFSYVTLWWRLHVTRVDKMISQDLHFLKIDHGFKRIISQGSKTAVHGITATEQNRSLKSDQLSWCTARNNENHRRVLSLNTSHRACNRYGILYSEKRITNKGRHNDAKGCLSAFQIQRCFKVADFHVLIFVPERSRAAKLAH